VASLNKSAAKSKRQSLDPQPVNVRIFRLVHCAACRSSGDL